MIFTLFLLAPTVPSAPRRRGKECEGCVGREAGAADIVGDADGESVLRLRLRKFVENGFGELRGEVFRRQAVAAADDARHGAAALRERRDHVLVERLTGRAGLLGLLQDRDRADGLWEGGDEGGGVEGAIETDRENADFFATGAKRGSGVAGGSGAGAHEDDDALGVGGAIVVEQMVVTAC
jgi:hypothetical protein